MTLLFITHDIALASGFVDRIAVFRNARLVEAGPIRSVLSAPESDYTAALIASHCDLATPPLIAEVRSWPLAPRWPMQKGSRPLPDGQP